MQDPKLPTFHFRSSERVAELFAVVVWQKYQP